MARRTYPGRKIIVFLLCAVMLFASMVPGVVINNRAEATGDEVITVYFDTGGNGPSSNGWTENMTVYYHTSTTKDSNDKGIKSINFTAQMTPTTLPSIVNPSGNGKLWKVELPASNANRYLSFSGSSGNRDHWNRTSMRDNVQVKNNIVIFANGTEQDGYWQSWYKMYKPTVTDYAGDEFRIANMTSQSVAFDILFYSSDGTNTLLWKYTDSIEGQPSRVISGRNLGVTFKVPAVAAGTTPYSGVKFIRRQINGVNDTFSNLDGSADSVIDSMYNSSEKGTLIKDYEFTKDKSQSKCLGKTLKYGITQFGTAKSQYADDADNMVLTFNTAHMTAPAAVTDSFLYLEKGSEDKAGFDQYGSADNIKVYIGGTIDPSTGAATGYTKMFSVKCLDPDGDPTKASGNASYMVDGDNSDDSFSVPAGTVFSIVCHDTAYNKYDIYNLFWDDPSKDLCILAYGDAAQVTDTRTVQGIGTMNGQKYMTVKADFFDYQYDKFKYSYTTARGSADHGGGSDNPAINQTYMTNQDADANSKRPYLAINEAISASPYGENTNYPMYLGQFWMPLYDDGDFYGYHYNNTSYNTSGKIYTSTHAENQRAAYDDPGQQYYIAGQQENGYYINFGFGNKLNNFKWPANLAYRTSDQKSGTYKPYDAVAKNLVYEYLEGSSEDHYASGGRLMAPGKASGTYYSVPYFDETWWTGTTPLSQGGPMTKSDYLTTYENLDFPFFEVDSDDISFISDVDKGGKILSDDTDTEYYAGKYYLFDSQKYSVRVSSKNGTTYLAKHNDAAMKDDYQYMVYDNYGKEGWGEDTDKGRTYGLFPFNGPGKSSGNHYYDREDLHYGFGIRYDIDFYMTETGTVDGSAGGTPITFTFQGDDDVWVFLDGRLLLDMGGAHKNAVGEINFKNKKAWISSAGSVSDSSIVSDRKSPSTLDFSTSTWSSRLTEGEHTITMFYMERGMLNSNLYCMFNLPSNITKLQLQEDTDFGNVNAGFAAATKYVADNDVFNYTIENKNSSTVLGSAYQFPMLGTVSRSNSESGTADTTALNNTTVIGTHSETRTRMVFDDDHLYLDTSDTDSRSQNQWGSGDVLAAYIYDTGGHNVELKILRAVAGEDHLQKCDYSGGKLGVYFLRLPPEVGFTYSDWSRSDSSGSAWDNNISAMITYLKGVNNRTYKNSCGDTWATYVPWYSRTTEGASFDSEKNRFVLAWKDAGMLNKPTYGTNIKKSEEYSVEVSDAHTYNFKNDVAAGSGGYQPVVSNAAGTQGVTYQLEDMFALSGSNTAPVTFDTRQYNSTGNANIVSLQYGEMATLSKQFSANSSMRVTQLDTLSAPNGGNSRLSGLCDDTGTRKVSKYYTTYVKTGENTGKLKMLPSPGIYKGEDVASIVTSPTLRHANIMYEKTSGTDEVLKDALTDKNYSNNTIVNLQRSVNETTKDISTTYILSDPEQGTNTNVFLRQVIVNAVNTADLRLAKYMTAVEAPAGKTFTFTVKFTGVFGDTSAAAVNKIDTSQIRYYADDNPATETTFASGYYSNAAGNKTVTVVLQPNHSITITGIPVGTDYQITEAADTTFTLDKTMSQNLEFDASGNITVTELTKDVDVDVFNKVKTGAVKLRKVLLDTNDSPMSSDVEFDFVLRVTSVPPDAGSIGGYAITEHKKGTPATTSQVLWDKDMTNPSNPVYSLTVKVKPSVASSDDNDVILEGFPVGTTYNVAEIAKSGYAQQGSVSFSDDTKTVNNYYLGAAVAAGSEESNDTTHIDLITITNKIVPIVMPSTGGDGTIFILPIGIIAIALSGAAFVIYRRRLVKRPAKHAAKGRL